LFLSSNAQNEFKTFTKSDGLTSSNILFTHVDTKGIIWATTSSGVNAFTGKKWVSIKSITDNDGRERILGKVLKVFETKNGELWIATEKGMFHYNRQYWTHYSDHENRDFHVVNIFEDHRGFIWVMIEKSNGIKDVGEVGFSIAEGRLQMFNGSQWFDFPGMIGGTAAVKVGEPLDYFTSIMQDTKENIWVTSLDGLYLYDGRSWTEFDREVLPTDKCYKVIETFDSVIWVATSSGIAKQDGDKWIKYEKVKGIKDNLTYDLIEDSKNRLWAFTRKDHKFKALCFYENDKWESCFNNDIHIKGEVSQLFEYNDKILAFSNKGISLFDEGKWNSLEVIYKFNDDNFSEIIKAKDNSFWFTTQTGLYHLNDNMKKEYSSTSKWKTNSLFEASNGDIWVGTDKNGVYKINESGSTNYTVSNGLKDNHINEIFEDSRKNIWIVTRNGISKFN